MRVEEWDKINARAQSWMKDEHEEANLKAKKPLPLA
jgi:hypothetical protein